MDDLVVTWKSVEAAGELSPLPAGKYRCRLVGGMLGKSRRGTPGFKLTFEVLEGEYVGRLVWHDLWLTQKAMPYTKRDLGKIGITCITQLNNPIPSFVCEVVVALRCNDDEVEHNKVRSFTVVGTETTNPFSPLENVE